MHGFNSSSASSKAQAMLAHCKEAGVRCVAPDLPHRPSEALELARGICAESEGEVTAVGSSLGGHYATWLVENRHAARAVLVNPAVDVADKLKGEVGKVQTNYNDGSTYEFTEGHFLDLKESAVGSIADPKRYLLLVQKGDEVLDYKEAVEFYEGCEQVVEDGGDHSFAGFERLLGRIARFASGG